MSRKRQFTKYLKDLFKSDQMKELVEAVWKDMGITLPVWPDTDGEPMLSVRAGIAHAPNPEYSLYILKMRLLQKFKTGDPATFVECEIFSDMIIDLTAMRGLPKDVEFGEDLKETMRLELLELKDYFIKTINEERVVGLN